MTPPPEMTAKAVMDNTAFDGFVEKISTFKRPSESSNQKVLKLELKVGFMREWIPLRG